jgi:hypothetical protein
VIVLFLRISSDCVLILYLLFIQVVAGGGAVEAALSVYLENLATTLGSREQLAIAEFAESFLIIPKVLICSVFCVYCLTLNQHHIKW